MCMIFYITIHKLDEINAFGSGFESINCHVLIGTSSIAMIHDYHNNAFVATDLNLTNPNCNLTKIIYIVQIQYQFIKILIRTRFIYFLKMLIKDLT